MHFRKRKNLRKRSAYAGFGADSRTRTDGLLITNELLYQLSHISMPGVSDDTPYLIFAIATKIL